MADVERSGDASNDPNEPGRKALSKIREELTCSICKGLFDDPKTLPCLHSFCCKCLDEHAQKRPLDKDNPEGDARNTFLCPLCNDQRSRVSLKDSGVNGSLKTNFALRNLVSHLRLEDTVTGGVDCQSGAPPGSSSDVSCSESSAEPPPKEEKCTECEEEVAVHFCTVCNWALCTECKRFHSRSKRTRNHSESIVPLGKQLSQESPDQVEPDLKKQKFPGVTHNAWTCEKHGDKHEVEMYCKRCDEVVCMRCALESHKGQGHDCEFASGLHETYKAEIIQLRGEVRDIQKSFEEAITRIQATKDSLTETEKTAGEDICRQYEKIVAKLQEQKGALIQRVTDIASRKRACLDGQQKELERMKGTLQSNTKFTQDVCDNCIPIEFMFLWSQIKKRLVELHDDYRPHPRDPRDNDIVNFTKNGEFDAKLDSEGYNTIGEVFADPHPKQFTADDLDEVHFLAGRKSEFTVTCRDIVGTKLQEDHHEVKVEMKPEGEGPKSSCSVENNHDGTYKVTATPLVHGMHELTISVQGQGIPHPCKWTPLNKRVAPLPCNVTEASRIINKSDTRNKMKNPWGVAVSKDGRIVISDIETNCLIVLSDQWEYQTSFGKKGDKEVEFKSPRGLAVTQANTVLVAEKDNHRVQELTLEGEFVRFFGTNRLGMSGSKAGQFRNPTGVAVNSDGIVFVTDSINQRIQYFKHDGSHLGIIGKWGSGPGANLNEPYAITVYNYQVTDQRGGGVKDRELIFVTERQGFGVQCFERQENGEYQPIRKFPASSSKPTKLNQPVGIAVDTRSGYIYVAELQSQKISILSRRGELIKSFGERGDGPVQFHNPMSIAVLHDSKIVVTDCANGRLCVFKVLPD